MKVCSVCQRCYEDAVLSCVKKNHHDFQADRAEGREIITGFRLDFLRGGDAASKIYQATNIHLDQPCLIKIFPPVPVDDASKLNQQFIAEAQLIAELNHPNLVQIYEAGVFNNGESYLITEIVSGQTLRDYLSKMGSPSEVMAVQIARQTAEALESIHAVGVTHRNINTENIILTSDTEHRLLVKLQNFDFGGINQQITLSETSNPEHKLNHLRYFSPEQCGGQTVDAQTDVYSLGIVLYEMLAGHPPFDATEADELIDKQIKDSPPEIKISNFDVRALLTHTLMDSLQKTTRLRIKKAGILTRQLRYIEQLATHLPTPPPAVSLPVTNKVATIQPETQNIGVSSATTIFDDLIEVEKASPTANRPETDDIAEAMPDNEFLIPSAEPAEVMSAKSELNAEPESAQPEPILVEEVKTGACLLDSTPVLVEWEQPEDISSELEAIDVRREELGDSDFAPSLSSSSEEPLIMSDEPESVLEAEVETDEEPRWTTDTVPVFSTYTESEPRRFPVINQNHIIGGGLIVLILLALTGIILVLEPFQSVEIPQQTAAQVPSPEKILPKPVEPEVVPTKEIDLTQTAEKETDLTQAADKTDSKDEAAVEDAPVIPNFKMPEVKKEPALASVTSKRAERNQTAEKTPDNKTKQNVSNAKENVAKNEVKPQKIGSDTIIVVGKQSSSAPKNNGLTRPRVVKVSKPQRLPF